MKFFKSKEEKITEKIINNLKSINLDSANEKAEKIDEYLSVLYNNITYEEYIKFIKENELLNHYDDIMGKYANNDPIAKTLGKSIPDSFYDDVENIVKNKIDELNL